ncbi:RNA-directed DNA polymerase from transposon BS [Mizuhopecten yessoensis]|uniref:RNA-directed DNA polymerase from transposon BS n=1 Tax=Mizuhopecten yessoensis TaxID=6573 RepID=A0A210QEX7_MIZYE|nr:RNA-directed DNA polymerase from transposon BS [Mizuhopecten yessoensis]
MGCCTDTWRCAIGIYYCKTRSIGKRLNFINKTDSFATLFKTAVYSSILFAYLSCMQALIKQNSIVLVLLLKLLLSCDIHQISSPILYTHTYGCLSLTVNYDCMKNLINLLSVFLFSCFRNSNFSVILLLLLLMYMDVESNPGPSSGELSVFHLNIRSIRNKMDYIEDIAGDYDIVCLTESHLDDHVLSEDILLPGFHAPFRLDRNFAGGGVIVYVNSLLKVNRLANLEYHGDEAIWIQVILQHTSFIICTIYRPENSVLPFWDNLRASIYNAFDISPNLIITGDFNVDLLTVATNHVFLDIISSFSLSNVILEPTRIGQTRSSLLDPIFLSDSLSCIDSSVINIDRTVSDHQGCIVSVELPCAFKSVYKRKVWLYKRADFVTLNNLISQYDWNGSFLNCESVDIACETFTNVFIEFATMCIPTKEVMIRPNDKPWMTSDLRKNIRKRDRLHKIARKSNRLHDIQKFKSQRNKVNNMKKYSRLDFYENVHGIIDDYFSSDPKAYWRLIKRLMKSSGTSQTIPTLVDPVTENIISSDEGKSNLLNEYFCSITRINERNVRVPDIAPKTNKTFDSIRLNYTEIMDVLQILKLGKASGQDEISHYMLKNVCHTICKPLELLFNISLSAGVYPKLWKLAKVMPLFKKGDRHSPLNYRPISLLSTVGKVFERVIFKHIYNYFFENSLFYKYQSGFLPGHSTVYQLIEMYHNICLSLEEKKHTCIVFCDISKAFDRVWHNGLYIKLKSYGIGGELLVWLKDYLHQRQQKVCVNESFSKLGSIDAGVPQGSILGPLLFLIYINDIADIFDSASRLFADDTSLQCSSSSCLEIQTILNKDLESLNSWAKTWLVTFNPDKTDVLFFSNRNDVDALLELEFDGNILDFSDSHKHLGVTLNSSVKWGDHIEAVYSSVMKKINVLRKLKFLLKRDALLRIYRTFILPILEYACELWDGCSSFESEKLEKAQREAARIITGLPSYASIYSLNFETGLETLSARRKRRKLQLLFKMHVNQTPDYFSSLLSSTVQDLVRYPLRNRNDYRIPYFRLSTTNSSFLPSTLRCWNTLDNSIRSSASLNIFKNSLKPNDQFIPPSYFCNGDRKLNVIHTKLRHRCSSLNYDLFRVNLVETPSCICGHICENVYHFFFQCRSYSIERNILFQRVNDLSLEVPCDLDLLLFGNEDLSLDTNSEVFLYVHNFIKSSKRF